MPDADEAILDYAFRLDPREERVSLEDLVVAEAILDAGSDYTLPGHVSPQAAWELFRAIIAAAILTPDCFVDRVPVHTATDFRQDQVHIRTPAGTHGELMFWGPTNAQARSQVTWEVGSTMWQRVSSLTTVVAIETVLHTDPSDRPSIRSSEAFTPPA